jgi:hypothetical protein
MLKAKSALLRMPQTLDQTLAGEHVNDPTTASLLDNVIYKNGGLVSRGGQVLQDGSFSGRRLRDPVTHAKYLDEEEVVCIAYDSTDNRLAWAETNHTQTNGTIASSAVSPPIASKLVGANVTSATSNFTVLTDGSGLSGLYTGAGSFTKYTLDTSGYQVTGSGATAVAGGYVNSVCVHSGHIMWTDSTQAKVYYTSTGALAGVIGELNLAQFITASKLAGCASCTITDGQGALFPIVAFFGTNGSFAAYTGNPEDTTFTLIGRGRVGAITNPRAIIGTGNDILIATDSGLQSLRMNMAGQGASISLTAARAYHEIYSRNAELVFDSSKNILYMFGANGTNSVLVANLGLEPTDVDGYPNFSSYSNILSSQITWGHRPLGISTSSENSFITFEDSTLSTDNGADIIVRVSWAPASFGTTRKKKWIKANVTWRVTGNPVYGMTMESDYFSRPSPTLIGGMLSTSSYSWTTLETLTWGGWEALEWQTEPTNSQNWRALDGSGHVGALKLTVATSQPIKFLGGAVWFATI